MSSLIVFIFYLSRTPDSDHWNSSAIICELDVDKPVPRIARLPKRRSKKRVRTWEWTWWRVRDWLLWFMIERVWQWHDHGSHSHAHRMLSRKITSHPVANTQEQERTQLDIPNARHIDTVTYGIRKTIYKRNERAQIQPRKRLDCNEHHKTTFQNNNELLLLVRVRIRIYSF